MCSEKFRFDSGLRNRKFIGISGLMFIFSLVQLSCSQDPTRVRYVGMIYNKKLPESEACQGVFLTLKFLATSCRCLGTTDSKTLAYYQGVVEDYVITTWSDGPYETQLAAKLHFHEDCGIDPATVYADLGLVETQQGFSAEAATTVSLPNARKFRFHNYIKRLERLQMNCISTNQLSPPGTTLVFHVIPPASCIRTPSCSLQPTNLQCSFLTLTTNHICAYALDPQLNTWPRDQQVCPSSSGAPLVCHGMLVGINGRHPGCNSPFNPYYFIRLDIPMDWIMRTIC